MNVISEELNRIKCLFNYKPGSVISEQENSSENKYSMQNTVILRIKRSQQGGVKIFKGLVFTKKGNDIITNRTQINSYNDFYEYHGQIQYFCNTKTFKIVNSTYNVIEKQEFVNSSLSKNLDNKLCNTSNNNQVINEPMSADTTSKEAIQPTEPTHTYPNNNNTKIYGKSYYIVGGSSYSLENSKSKTNAELKIFKNTKFVKTTDGNLIANTKYQFVSSIFGHVITDPIKNTESSNPSKDTYSGSITFSCKYKIFTPDKFKDLHYYDEEKTLQSKLDGVCKSKDDVKTEPETVDSTDTTSKEAIQPTEPTHTYPNDKNYKYAKDNAGNWWGLNIINNKWFNLIDYPESIEKLNTGAVEI